MSQQKISFQDKEIQLIKKIEKAKKELGRLQQKQKNSLGALALKYSLDNVNISQLEAAFEKLSNELLNK